MGVREGLRSLSQISIANALISQRHSDARYWISAQEKKMLHALSAGCDKHEEHRTLNRKKRVSSGRRLVPTISRLPGLQHALQIFVEVFFWHPKERQPSGAGWEHLELPRTQFWTFSAQPSYLSGTKLVKGRCEILGFLHSTLSGRKGRSHAG